MTQQESDDPPAAFGRYGSGLHQALRYAALAGGLMAMMAMTVPHLRASSPWPAVTLWACLAFFTAELAVRSKQGIGRGDGSRYISSTTGVIDALAVFPVPLALLAGVQAESAWLFGALWVFKLAESVPGLSMLLRIVRIEARPLASVLIIFLIVLLLAGVSLHLLERAGQPDKFGSLPMSMWWAVTTLTTTGYGDAVPETFLGRIVAGIVMICGLGVFGLWTGILATGFAAEHRRREFMRNYDLVARVPFLRTLDGPSIIQLTHLLRRLDLAERSTVVRQGRPGDCMYFIAAGEVEVKIEPKPVRLGAGSFFGEFALLDGSPRTASVTTTRPSTFLILDVSDFRSFTAHHPELAREIEIEAKRRKPSNPAEPNPRNPTTP